MAASMKGLLFLYKRPFIDKGDLRAGFIQGRLAHTISYTIGPIFFGFRQIKLARNLNCRLS